MWKNPKTIFSYKGEDYSLVAEIGDPSCVFVNLNYEKAAKALHKKAVRENRDYHKPSPKRETAFAEAQHKACDILIGVASELQKKGIYICEINERVGPNGEAEATLSIVCKWENAQGLDMDSLASHLKDAVPSAFIATSTPGKLTVKKYKLFVGAVINRFETNHTLSPEIAAALRQELRLMQRE